MSNLFLVGLGGAIGAMLRYSVGIWSKGIPDWTDKLPDELPYGTLLVNLIGSLIIGFCWGLIAKSSLSRGMEVFIMIGILGGFTTFSSFSLDNIKLLESGKYGLAFIYIGLSCIGGLVLAYSAYIVSK